MSKRNKAGIDGNHVLYHYLQKDLFKSDVWLFQMLTSKLVGGLGIWLHPDIYRHMPILLPFAIRDPTCRKRDEGDIEAWGSPNEIGYLRDDNSLVKSLCRSLTVQSPQQPIYDGRRLGNGFVASHVWRGVSNSQHGAELASRDPWTNTFVPNLVWLPSQVAKLADREGSFTQLYLQALAAKVYRHLEVPAPIRPFIEQTWNMLSIPRGIPSQGLPQPSELAYFKPTPRFFAERTDAILKVVSALERLLNGQPLVEKVVTTRYAEGLANVSRDRLAERHHDLRRYLNAIKETDAQQRDSGDTVAAGVAPEAF